MTTDLEGIGIKYQMNIKNFFACFLKIKRLVFFKWQFKLIFINRSDKLNFKHLTETYFWYGCFL